MTRKTGVLVYLMLHSVSVSLCLPLSLSLQGPQVAESEVLAFIFIKVIDKSCKDVWLWLHRILNWPDTWLISFPGYPVSGRIFGWIEGYHKKITGWHILNNFYSFWNFTVIFSGNLGLKERIYHVNFFWSDIRQTKPGIQCNEQLLILLYYCVLVSRGKIWCLRKNLASNWSKDLGRHFVCE